jgi:hypothetical protein
MKKQDKQTTDLKGRDLKGVASESWRCVDCNINTAPGWPNREEMERPVILLLGP